MKTVFNFITKWMAALVLAVAALALFVPETFTWIGKENTKLVINCLLGLVMFGMGMTINMSDFKVVFSRPKDIIIGAVAQFTIMPFLAWGLTKVFNLPPELAIGVILVGACPGGTASNVMTYLAGGDVALSVGMTGVSTILAPIMTPFITYLLAGQTVDVDFWGMLLSIVEVVIVPIIIGFLLKYFLPRLTKALSVGLPAFSTIVIMIIVGIVVSGAADNLMKCGLLIILIVALHNVCGFILGYTLGKLLKLEHKKCSAISIEVGMQNSGLAVALAKDHFRAFALATVPGAVFSVWHNIAGALIAKLFLRMKEK